MHPWLIGLVDWFIGWLVVYVLSVCACFCICMYFIHPSIPSIHPSIHSSIHPSLHPIPPQNYLPLHPPPINNNNNPPPTTESTPTPTGDPRRQGPVRRRVGPGARPCAAPRGVGAAQSIPRTAGGGEGREEAADARGREGACVRIVLFFLFCVCFSFCLLACLLAICALI